MAGAAPADAISTVCAGVYFREKKMKRKYLCICAGGNNRSAALAYILKSKRQDAVAVGTDHVTAETLIYFAVWADFIVPVTGEQRRIIEKILPIELLYKIVPFEFGPDMHGPALNQDFLTKSRIAEKHLTAMSVPIPSQQFVKRIPEINLTTLMK